MRKKGILMLAIGLLAVGFASVSTTLILTGSVSIGVNKDDFEVVFASANIDGGHASISKTTKKGDTLTFSTLDISKVDEPVVLNYTVKNNSTQYGAEVSIKCYAVNDTNHYLNDYITLTGVFGTQNITFGVDETSSTLSEAETINAQGILSGSITINLNKPFLDSEGNDGKLSIACKLSASATEQTSAGVRPTNTLASNTEIDDIKGNLKSFTKVTGKKYDYEVSVDEGTTEVILDVKTKNLYSEVYVGKVEDTSTLSSTSDNYQVNLLGVSLLTGSNIEYTKNKKVHLDSDENYFKVKVISEDESEESVYTIKIKRQEPVLLNSSITDSNTLVTSAPTLTNTSEATNQKGLYSSTETNSGNPTYYFRGNVTNNYLDFAGFKWRIVRINEDDTVRLLMTNGINNDHLYQYTTNGGTYNGMYFTNSDVIKPELDLWFARNIQNKGISSKIATGEYFCEQSKYHLGAMVTGNASTPSWTKYAPSFKCETDGNGKGLVNTNVALLTYDEAVFAGNYYDKTNNSSYIGHTTAAFTMSPVGYDTSYNLSYLHVYGFGIHSINIAQTVVEILIRPVINLNSDVRIIGTGVVDDPYIVQ